MICTGPPRTVQIFSSPVTLSLYEGVAIGSRVWVLQPHRPPSSSCPSFIVWWGLVNDGTGRGLGCGVWLTPCHHRYQSPSSLWVGRPAHILATCWYALVFSRHYCCLYSTSPLSPYSLPPHADWGGWHMAVLAVAQAMVG